jgi:PST family polysaccharide transporter
MAFSLAMVPVDKVAAVVSQVTTSLFAAVQDNAVAARRYMLALTEGFALIGFPTTLGMALVADEFVMLVLGPNWASVVGPLRILAFYATYRSTQSLPTQVLFVTGGARLAMMNSLLTEGVLPLAFYLGTRWGIVGVAAAWLVVHPLAAIPINWRVFNVLGMSLREYLRALWPAFTGALVMMGGVLGLQTGLPTEWSPAAHLGGVVGGAAALYAAFMLTFHRARLTAFVRIIRRRAL